MPDEPTLGEVVRRLTDITAQLSAITTQLRTDFVRADVYMAHRDATKEDIQDVRDAVTDINKKREDDQKWRRTALLTGALAAGGWLLTIIGLVVAAAALLKG